MHNSIRHSAMEAFRNQIRVQVEDFFAAHSPEESCLVLDSTGPAATKHYLALSMIGLERLSRMKQIHGFSGGAFAYFGFEAIRRGLTNHTVADLSKPPAEAAIRKLHHPSMLGPLKTVSRLLFRKTAFGTTVPFAATMDFIFSAEHLARPLSAFPPNVTVYVGHKQSDRPIAVSASGAAAAVAEPLIQLPIRELVTLACLVPFVYGRADRSDAFFDAVYTPGYRSTLKSLCNQELPTLFITPWRSGQKKNVRYLNCYGEVNQKLQMFADFSKLLLNVPNHDWGRDIQAAFQHSIREYSPRPS